MAIETLSEEVRDMELQQHLKIFESMGSTLASAVESKAVKQSVQRIWHVRDPL